MNKIVPNLWFDNKAEEAANFYVGIFSAKTDDSKILNIVRYGDAGAEVSGQPKDSVMTVAFQLAGQDFLALNGGPEFKFSEAVSFIINCESQAEVDYFWEKLTNGGEEIQCGWLKDKFGLSWQVTPTVLDEMLTDKNPKKTESVMQAMLKMKKIDIAGLMQAYENG